mgnify:CR=1 FL=1
MVQGNKISSKFKDIEKALLEMYDESLSKNQVMYYLCHIAVLDRGHLNDDVIISWGTKKLWK